MFQIFWLAGSKLSKLHTGTRTTSDVANASLAIHILWTVICQVKSITWPQNAFISSKWLTSDCSSLEPLVFICGITCSLCDGAVIPL